MRKYLLILLISTIFLSEIILRVNEIAGFIFYISLITGVLISFHKAESLDDYGKLAVIFTIIPILRIAELFITLEFFWKTLIFYYLLFFLVTFYSIKFKINPGYTKKGLILMPLVIFLAISLGYLGNAFLNLDKYIGLLALLPIIAYSEEVLFRGLIQNLIKKIYSPLTSILSTALLYGIFSLSYSFSAIIFFFITALIISLVYNYTKNIFLTITINLILHFFLFVLA